MTAADELLQETPAARPCVHPRANHQHGTREAYAYDRCRCRPCMDAVNAYAQNRRRQIAYGSWSAFEDAEPARLHVQELMRFGLSWKTVAARAKVSQDTVHRLLYGHPGRGRPPAVRIRPATATKLLAVTYGRHKAATENPDLFTEEVLPHDVVQSR